MCKKKNNEIAAPVERLVMCKQVEDVAGYLADYWGTYMPMQPAARSYTAETVINDALYGLGAALNDKYRFANGYAEFKRDLLAYLST